MMEGSEDEIDGDADNESKALDHPDGTSGIQCPSPLRMQPHMSDYRSKTLYPR